MEWNEMSFIQVIDILYFLLLNNQSNFNLELPINLPSESERTLLYTPNLINENNAFVLRTHGLIHKMHTNAAINQQTNIHGQTFI